MSSVLVTGGAGFIGSHVADALLQRGHLVTVLDDLSGGDRDNVPSAASFVHGSVVDAPLVDRLCAEHQFDAIVHLAAYAAEGLSHFIKRFNYTNNVIGSVTLLNAAINTGVRRFVFTSSIAVYGTHADLPLTEETPVHPEDSYGIAKHAVELELKACRDLFGLEYVVFRPHNVYGPRQNIGDPYRNVIGIFMNQILQGKPMTIFGDGSQSRAFSYIDDVAPVIAESVDGDAFLNDVFNLGADQPYTLNQLAAAVADAMGVASDVVHLAPRSEVQHAYASHTKVRRLSGRCDETPLTEGLSRMATWVRRHGARKAARFEGIEIMRNLPAAWRA